MDSTEPHYYHQQREKMEELHQQLKTLDPVPTKDMINDFEEFLEVINCNRIKLCVNLFNTPDNQLGVRWHDDTVDFVAIFHGQGHWRYTVREPVDDGSFEMSFVGTGHLLEFDDDKHIWMMLLDERAEKTITLKDEFSQLYEPKIEMYSKNRDTKNKVIVQWTTNYYDGMLSGYCSYNGKLCYFDCVEETTYDRQRVFAMYKLRLIDIIKATFSHWTWRFARSDTWYGKLLWKWYCFKSSVRTTKGYEKARETKQRWLDRMPILGYFHY